MHMLQCGTGSFLRKYLLHKIFPTKVLLHENFWIYGSRFYLVFLRFAVFPNLLLLHSYNYVGIPSGYRPIAADVTTRTCIYTCHVTNAMLVYYKGGVSMELSPK